MQSDSSNAGTILEEGLLTLLANQNVYSGKEYSLQGVLRLQLLDNSLSQSLNSVLVQTVSRVLANKNKRSNDDKLCTDISIAMVYNNSLLSELYAALRVEELTSNNNSCQHFQLTTQKQHILTIPYPVSEISKLFKLLFPNLQGQIIVPNENDHVKKIRFHGIKGDKSRIFWQSPKQIQSTLQELGFQTVSVHKSDYPNIPEKCSTSETFGICFLEAHLVQQAKKPVPPYCIVPRVKGIGVINKCFLISLLHRWDTNRFYVNPSNSKDVFCSKSFLPPTLLLGFAKNKDILAFINKNPGVLLLKPGGNAMGIGIIILRCSNDEDNTKKVVSEIEDKYNKKKQQNDYVLQKYIERPLILDKRKCDMRVFVLLIVTGKTSKNKGGMYIFMHPGYVKLSSKPFSMDDINRETHLTNLCIQTKSEHFHKLKETLTWFPDELNEYFNKRLIKQKLKQTDSKYFDWPRQILYNKLCAVIGYTMASNKMEILGVKNANDFEILAADVLVDEDLNVYLLEIQSGPGLNQESVALRGTIQSMLAESHCIVAEVFQRTYNNLPVKNLATAVNFKMCYSSEDTSIIRHYIRNYYWNQ